jgi:hypothetical protein
VGQILAKTDGVPLFVEELTKTVLESIASLESVESVESEENSDGQRSGGIRHFAGRSDGSVDRLGVAKRLRKLVQ